MAFPNRDGQGADPGASVSERPRLVERVVHEVADVSPDDTRGPPATLSPLGLFADDPDAVDEMMKTVTAMRRRMMPASRM